MCACVAGRVRTQLQVLKHLPGQEVQAVPWPASVDPANPAAASLAAALNAALIAPAKPATGGESSSNQCSLVVCSAAPDIMCLVNRVSGALQMGSGRSCPALCGCTCVVVRQATVGHGMTACRQRLGVKTVP